MREIKFRAWWKTQSVMAPVYNLEYDFHKPQENMPSTNTLILKTLCIDTHSTYPYKDFLNHGKIGWNNPNMMVNVEECVLMQYTGLNDKNGKEIYEGDIVRHITGGSCTHKMFGGDGKWHYHYWHRVVEYFLDYDGEHIHPFQLSNKNHNTCHPEECEVIGSIYENGDLLNGK